MTRGEEWNDNRPQAGSAVDDRVMITAAGRECVDDWNYDHHDHGRSRRPGVLSTIEDLHGRRPGVPSIIKRPSSLSTEPVFQTRPPSTTRLGHSPEEQRGRRPGGGPLRSRA